MALDATGAPWIAWYSNATGNTGIFLQRVDPATGAGVGTPQKAPASEPTQNGSQTRMALACPPAPAGGACRVAYLAPTGPGTATRVVTWAPGEAAPAPVATGGNPTSANGAVTAAYRADGRLWVAWTGNGTTPGSVVRFATLGDGRGAGGDVVSAGSPPDTGGSVPLESLAVGDNLLLVTLGGTGPSLYASVVQPVNFAVPDTTGIAAPGVVRDGPALLVAPKRISVAKVRRSKCILTRVQSTTPARVYVAIFSGPRSERRFGATVVRFTAPGKRQVCVKVPFNARTFNIRQAFRFAIAVKPGASPVKGEPKGVKPKTQKLVFFS
jgi:hypothetical protein